jgi:hypothetical protein
MKYYIIFFDDSFKEITEQVYNEIMSESGGNAIGKEIGESFYKFSDIRRILNEQDYKDQYPEKSPKRNSQPFPVRSLDELLEKYADFKYPQLKDLAQTTYSQLKDLDEAGFKDYCLRHKAVLLNGKIITTIITNKDGEKKPAAFAFPFFTDIWNLIQREKSKYNYAVEMSWEEIGRGFNGVMDMAKKTSHIEAAARGLKKVKDKLEAKRQLAKNIDELLKVARLRYLKIQHEA